MSLKERMAKSFLKYTSMIIQHGSEVESCRVTSYILRIVTFCNVLRNFRI